MKKSAVAGLCVVGAVGAVVVAALGQPETFHVERSTTITVNKESVYPHLNSLKKFKAWNPWAKKDPNMKETYEGAEEGVGAKYAWEGNGDVGSGSMTITDAKPNESVVVKLDFKTPMESSAQTTWTLSDEGGQTKVTWAMDGKNSFVGRIMCMFMNMDAMVGGDFEKGLSDLKAIAENKAPTIQGQVTQ